jgi:hypothetical protein
VIKVVVVAGIALSCAAPRATVTQAAMIAVAPGVVSPEMFGAAPTTPGAIMADARGGLQAAIDAAPDNTELDIGPGRWETSRAPAGSLDRIASLHVHGRHLVIRGAGPSTVIAPTGDAGNGAWYGINVTDAVDVTLADLTIDTSAITGATDEQTHAIQILGPARGVRLERVRFVHPRAPAGRAVGARFGDCLRLIGNPNALVEDVSLIDASFDECARSGIGIQRGVFGLQVIGGRFEAIGKTAIDTEPTSDGGNGDVSLIESRITIIGCDFKRRGLWAYRVDRLTIAATSFEGAPTQVGGGLVELRNVASDVSIAAGTSIRRLGTVPGSALRIVHQSGGYADRVRVTGSSIASESPGQVISIESAQDVTLADLDVDYTGTSTAGQYCVYLRASGRQVDQVDVHDVRCRAAGVGGYLAAVELSSSSFGFGTVSIHDNQSRNALQGLRCEGTGSFTRPVVAHGNNFDGAGPIALNCPPAVTSIVEQIQ